jgi:hypothetical protein
MEAGCQTELRCYLEFTPARNAILSRVTYTAGTSLGRVEETRASGKDGAVGEGGRCGQPQGVGPERLIQLIV